MFIDEVEVLDAAGANVALHRPYLKTHPAVPDAAYPDTNGKESTDGTIAAGFNDGHGYGYHLTTAGQPLIVDVTIDLGASRAISEVAVRAFDDGIHAYSPENVTVLTGDNRSRCNQSLKPAAQPVSGTTCRSPRPHPATSPSASKRPAQAPWPTIFSSTR